MFWQSVFVVYVTGPPASGKTTFSKKLLKVLLDMGKKAIYINVGELSITSGTVVEYDFVHDTYSIDYSHTIKVLKKTLERFLHKLKKRGYEKVFVIIDTHDSCFLKEFSKQIIPPSKILYLRPANLEEYRHLVSGKKWPREKSIENIEYFTLNFYQDDECANYLKEKLDYRLILVRRDLLDKLHTFVLRDILSN